MVQTLTTVNYKPVLSPPKTARSRRVVYLDEQTVQVLRDHRSRQREERLAAGSTWDSTHDLVFRDELGALNAALAQVCDKVVLLVAGLPLRLK